MGWTQGLSSAEWFEMRYSDVAAKQAVACGADSWRTMPEIMLDNAGVFCETITVSSSI
jgi:hypothetical protein